MQQNSPLIHTASGLKRFFSKKPLHSQEINVRGIGIREIMPPCMIRRPNGTMDYLIMLFHDSVSCETLETSKLSLHPSDTFFIRQPRSPQYYGNPSNNYCHSWIHCEGPLIEKILKTSHIPIERAFQIPNPGDFQKHMLEIHHELISAMHPDPVIVSNLLENCLRKIARATRAPRYVFQISPGLLSVQKAISDSIANSWTLSDLARISGMSIPHFCTRFKESFGLPPMQYLILQRMQQAEHLLSNQNFSVGEIAFMTGFEDPFHFSKMFKKHFGRSPREMRKSFLDTKKRAVKRARP